MQTCVMIYPYFNNPEMLEHQVRTWNQYPDDVVERVRLVVVDDCSDQPALPILKQCRLTTACYRLEERIPWNMHQCRNIGAREASSDDVWMFMSDIDIELRPDQVHKLLRKNLDPASHYTMERVFANTGERKNHGNTFMVRRSVFWQTGGYDLDLTPVGGGGYGGDGQFLTQLRELSPNKHLNDIVLIGYGRSHRQGQPVIADADTTSLDRETWHLKYIEALRRKRETGERRSVNPVRTPYVRVL